jgi:hypothetical protein
MDALEIGQLAGGHWGEGDRLMMAGVETWLLYFTVAEAHAELQAILKGQHLDRLDAYYYPIGRCAMWQNMRTFYDPDGLLHSFKQQLDPYPESLRRSMLAHHLQALEDVEDLERAVQRKDVFFYHFALDLALDHFLQALFAWNRAYFPSRKRSADYIQGFTDKPENCEERLRRSLSLGSQAETLEASYAEWGSLVRDLTSITATEE